MKLNLKCAACLATIAIAILAPFAAHAESKVPAGDVKFAKAAAQGGDMEVILGRYAAAHAADPKIREFGKRMVVDHSKANNELKKIALKEGIKLPTSRSLAQKAAADMITMRKGKAFDTAYVKAMVKDHTEDAAAFAKEAEGGADPGVKSFAQKTLPVVQMHQDMIKAEWTAMQSGSRDKSKMKM